MAAFQDYETAADGNGSVIIKLSTVSFFCETETRVVVISSKALFELWQLARQSPQQTEYHPEEFSLYISFISCIFITFHLCPSCKKTSRLLGVLC